MTLPADCQVALQSAKIQMDGSIVLGDNSSRTFYWYFGKVSQFSGGAASPYFATDANSTASIPVKVVLFPLIEGKVKTNIEELATELEKALNRACFHPNLHGRITVAKKYDGGTNGFLGFTFGFDEQIATGAFAPANRIPYLNTSVMLDGFSGQQRENQLTGTGNPPPYTLSRTVGPPGFLEMKMNPFAGLRSESVILNVAPLNLKGGQAGFNVSGYSPGAGIDEGKFAVGLTRPSLARDSAALGLRRGEIFPTWYHNRNGGDQPEWVNYFDFCATCNLKGDDRGTAGTKNFIRLFHTVVNPTDQGGAAQSQFEDWQRTPKFQAFKYGDGTNASVDTGASNQIVTSAGFSTDFGYDFRQNALNITGVLFTATGQSVKIELYDLNLSNAGHTKYTLYEYDDTRLKELNMKPIDQGCWSLLPQVCCSTRDAAGGDHAIGFERFDGVDNLYTAETGGTWDMLDTGADDGINRGRSSWELVNSTLSGSDAASRQLYSRFWMNYGILLGAVSSYIYDGIAGAPAANFTRQKQILILREQDATLFPYTEQADATKMLGFPKRSIVDFSAIDATHNFVVSSIAVPQILPTSSIFVRLHGFNQESTNAKARGKSDIIAHLPRFDGLHRSGPLYLEPNNLVYLDLNNPQPIKINSFDLSLCYSNEQYATGLTGTTIVVLHFKSKSK
tara:strand:- start:422 stop:2452 length:2031 start_codon:yes stop_codon:yes gene_type:complete